MGVCSSKNTAVALSALVHAVAEPKLEFVTARIVSGQGGPFVRAALLDAGRDQGVKAGYPVMSAQGLIGRVVAAGGRSARLLLLTDFNSRIPVTVGADGVRAVLEGDNSPLPKLAYLAAGSSIKPGDVVLSSGVGGLYPRGLRVGIVVDTGDGLRVEPAAQLDRLDYVSVLQFESPGALSEDEKAVEARIAPLRRTDGGREP